MWSGVCVRPLHLHDVVMELDILLAAHKQRQAIEVAPRPRDVQNNEIRDRRRDRRLPYQSTFIESMQQRKAYMLAASHAHSSRRVFLVDYHNTP